MTSNTKTATILWYKSLGPNCGYCGIEMIPVKEAFEKTLRSSGPFRAYYTKEQRRLPDDIPTVDHVVPRSKGGTSRMKNYVICCRRCNLEKGDKPHPGLPRDLKITWFETIDLHLIKFKSKPYPNPY